MLWEQNIPVNILGCWGFNQSWVGCIVWAAKKGDFLHTFAGSIYNLNIIIFALKTNDLYIMICFNEYKMLKNRY